MPKTNLNSTIRLLFYLSINAICLGLMWLSCYPHSLSEWSFMLLVFVGYFLYLYSWFITPIVLLVMVFIWRRRQKLNRSNNIKNTHIKSYLLQLAIATNRLIIITMIVLQTNLLQYAVFAVSLPAFQTLDPNCSKDCQVGFYRFELVDRDDKGGAYFQTSDFFFKSYGFAYKPDPSWNRGAPKQSFKYYPFWGDWKSYKESHDWN